MSNAQEINPGCSEETPFCDKKTITENLRDKNERKKESRI